MNVKVGQRRRLKNKHFGAIRESSFVIVPSLPKSRFGHPLPTIRRLSRIGRRTSAPKSFRTIGEAKRAVSEYEAARGEYETFVSGIGGQNTAKQMESLASNKTMYAAFLKLQNKLVASSERAAQAREAFPELYKK